jgi:hypothetical protein
MGSSLLLAKPGKVVTKQGQSFEGDVRDNRATGGSVEVIDANGRKVTLQAGNVNRVEYSEAPAPDETPAAADAPAPAPEPGSVEADLRQRLAALPRNDVQGRIKLARQSLERREYGVAQEALDQALGLDPKNQEAQGLRATVDAQRKLDQRQAQGGAQRPPAERAPGTGAAAGGNIPPVPPLNADDINRIRQREWTRNDKLVKVRFVNDVKRRYMNSARDVRPADFNNLNVLEQAWQIVSKGGEEFRNDVRLITDPRALHTYRTVVQRPLLQTCATGACHGGGAATSFQLYPQAQHDGEAYANFWLLSTHTYTPKSQQLAPAGQGAATGGGPGAGGGVAGGGGAAGAGGGDAGAPGAAGATGAREPGAAPGAQGAAGAEQRGAGQGAAPGRGAPGRGGAGGQGGPAAAGADAGGAAGAGARPGPGGPLSRGPRKLEVINRDRPADSLLLQFSLPPNLADTPHPNVPGFKPVFRVLKDPRYDQILGWISNELSPLQKDYGIKFDQAAGADVTAPTAVQAGQQQPQQQPGAAPGTGQPAPGTAPNRGAAQPGQPGQPGQGQGQAPGQQNPARPAPGVPPPPPQQR